MTPPSILSSLGKLRRTARISDADGWIRVAAIDHPESYRLLFDDDLSAVSHDEVVESKLELIEAMAPHSTALLLDPATSLAQAVAGGALPGDVGLISGIEDLYHAPDTSPTGFDLELRLKPGWGPAKLAALGCDAVKLVIFHRHDDPDDLQERHHGIVSEVAAECTALQLPLVLEPLWYPREGESLDDTAVQDVRTASVVSAAGSYRRAGGDIMKMEFPTVIGTEHGRAGAAAACEAMDAAVDGPWVLLSAGVTFDGFAQQLEIGARAGAIGFMAGRAIWGDAVGRHPAEVRAAGCRQATERLDRLAEIMAEHGTQRRTLRPSAEAARGIGPDWYEGVLDG